MIEEKVIKDACKILNIEDNTCRALLEEINKLTAIPEADAVEEVKVTRILSGEEVREAFAEEEE